MSKEFKKIIFDTNGYKFDDAKRVLIEDCNIENPSDEDVYEEINNCNDIALRDEIAEFAHINKKIEGKIVAIADLGLWNGRKPGLKFFNSLEEIIYHMCTYDSWELYIDRYQLRGIGHHHDGTNYILFKELKSNVDSDSMENDLIWSNLSPDEFEDKINFYTKSLRKYFKGYLY